MGTFVGIFCAVLWCSLSCLSCGSEGRAAKKAEAPFQSDGVELRETQGDAFVDAHKKGKEHAAEVVGKTGLPKEFYCKFEPISEIMEHVGDVEITEGEIAIEAIGYRSPFSVVGQFNKKDYELQRGGAEDESDDIVYLVKLEKTLDLKRIWGSERDMFDYISISLVKERNKNKTLEAWLHWNEHVAPLVSLNGSAPGKAISAATVIVYSCEKK